MDFPFGPWVTPERQRSPGLNRIADLANVLVLSRDVERDREVIDYQDVLQLNYHFPRALDLDPQWLLQHT